VLFTVLRQLSLLLEEFAADVALEGLHSRMDPQMINQIAFLSEWFIALSTDENRVESSCDLVDFLDFVVEATIYLRQNRG
jgi:hypothetical protein